jgi:hypothetical protein
VYVGASFFLGRRGWSGSTALEEESKEQRNEYFRGRKIFLCPRNFKLLSQIKGNLIDFLNFII